MARVVVPTRRPKLFTDSARVPNARTNKRPPTRARAMNMRRRDAARSNDFPRADSSRATRDGRSSVRRGRADGGADVAARDRRDAIATPSRDARDGRIAREDAPTRGEYFLPREDAKTSDG